MKIQIQRLNNQNIWLIAILALGLVARLYFLPITIILDGTSKLGYFSSLDNHFWEYLTYTNIKPPLTYIIHGSIVNLLPIEWITKGHSLLIFTIFLDYIGLLLLFLTLKRLELPSTLSLVVTGLYCFYLIPIEFWRHGTHYSHYNFFLTSAFIFCITKYLYHPSNTTGAWLSISGSLILAHNGVYSLATPLIIIACTFMAIGTNLNLVKYLKTTSVLIMLPVITILAIASKNYMTTGIFSPSTLGGAALSLVTMRSVDRRTDLIRPILDEAKLPDWYKWCFDNPNRYGVGLNGPVVIANSRSFGTCFPWSKKENKTWPVDMTALETQLEKLGAKEQLAKVRQDIYNMEHKRYLLYGFAPELSLNWSTIYMQEAGKIYWYDIKKNPIRYLKTFSLLGKDFLTTGPRYPKQALRLNTYVQKGLIYKSVKIIISIFAVIFQILGPLILLAAIFSIYWVFSRAINLIRGQTIIDIDKTYAVHMVLAFTALLFTILFSTIVGEENNRYFMYAAPYFLVSSLALFSHISHQAKG